MAKTIVNRFNLTDEDWIPVANAGIVSLRRIFTDTKLKALGGNPVTKISIFKLLLAICQAASTPADFIDWKKLKMRGLSDRVLGYLKDQHENFWLFGEKPFLQYPAVKNAGLQGYCALSPEIATGNTTVLFQTTMKQSMTDAQKAQLLVQLMGFALGGKKPDSDIILTKNYKGKTKTAKAGPCLGFLGYLHNFVLGRTILETLWFNLLTQQEIEETKIFQNGVGIPPWQLMPKGEDDNIARTFKLSYMGRLVPLSRFMLFVEEGVHYVDGLLHGTHKEGVFDPSLAIDLNPKNPKALWADPGKRPWRMLTALLSFLDTQKSNRYNCFQLKFGTEKAKASLSASIVIWSGGIRVSSNAGEQYASGTDDYVESSILIDKEYLEQSWFLRFEKEMDDLDVLSKSLFGRIAAYWQDLKSNGDATSQALSVFWQRCERQVNILIDACGDTTGEKCNTTRKTFASIARQVYDEYCPKDTARQLEAWAKNIPNLGKYLQKDNAPQKVGAKE